jgi:molybdopterin molybdotransferase
MEKLATYILAGGRSSRLGRDKARVALGGTALIARVAALAAPFASSVTAVADRKGKHASLGIRTIPDLLAQRGPLGGLLTALADLGDGWLLLLPCDLVELRAAWVERLCDARRADSQIVVFRTTYWEPMPGLYHTSTLATVRAFLEAGELALWRVYERLNTVGVPRPEDWPPVAQVNTPDDLRALAASHRVEPDQFSVEVPGAGRLPGVERAARDVSLREALSLVLEHAGPRPATEVGLDDATGLVLARDVVANRDLPGDDRSLMDGLAVRLVDAGQVVRVLGQVSAGATWRGELAHGSAVAVATGATCPTGTDAVVRNEDVVLTGDAARLPAAIPPGWHVERAGSACRQGLVVAPAGAAVTPLVIASLAAFSCTTVAVRPRPRVAILTSGDELATEGAPEMATGVTPSNGAMIESLAVLGGLEPVRREHVVDEVAALVAALRRARGVDLVVVCGGTGPGFKDLTARGFEAAGARMLVRGVRQRPGHTMLVASLGDALLFGLPGTPLACLVAFWRHVLPAARAMAGHPEPDQRWIGRLDTGLAPRRDVSSLILARASRGRAGELLLQTLGGHGGNDVFTPALANALIELPPGEQRLPDGASVEFLPLNGLL